MRPQINLHKELGKIGWSWTSPRSVALCEKSRINHWLWSELNAGVTALEFPWGILLACEVLLHPDLGISDPVITGNSWRYNCCPHHQVLWFGLALKSSWIACLVLRVALLGRAWRWEDSSVTKVLALQAWGPGFDFQSPSWKVGRCGNADQPCPGEADTS